MPRGLPGWEPAGAGAAAAAAPAQMAEFAAWVEAGPDPERDGVVRWRRRSAARIETAFGVELHERTVGKYWQRARLSPPVGAPAAPEADPEAQEAFKKTSPTR